MKVSRLFLCTLCFACSDLPRLARLGSALNNEFADTPIRVGLTSEIILTIEVTDSVLVRSSCEAQVGFAARVGRMVPEHFADFDSLQVVNVLFQPPESMGELPLQNAHLPIRFSPAVIRAGLPAPDSVRIVESCRAFEELNAGS